MTGRHFIADVFHQQGIEAGLIPDFELVRHAHQYHVLLQTGGTHQGLRDTYAALRIGDHPLRKTEQLRFDVGKLHGREGDAVQLFDDGFPIRRHVGLEASVQTYGQPEGTIPGGQQGIPVLWRQQQTRRTLITIGLVYSILLVVVEGAYAFLAADDISRWVISEQGRIDWTSVSANFPWDGTITALVLYIPGIMAVWFAPLLAAERRMTTGKSLFYSFFGCIRNIVPVIVLVLAVMMMLTLALVAVVSIALMFTSQTLVSILTIPFIFLAATVMYASYWPMYRDLFGDLG